MALGLLGACAFTASALATCDNGLGTFGLDVLPEFVTLRLEITFATGGEITFPLSRGRYYVRKSGRPTSIRRPPEGLPWCWSGNGWFL